MGLWNFSASEVDILLYGLHKVKGISTGTFVTVTKDVVPFPSARTTDGMVYRKYTNDQTFTIQLTLLAASPTNSLLTKLWLFDESTKMGKFPLLIKDGLGTSKFFSSTTWVEMPPPLSFSDDMETRTWLLRSSQAVINIGGSGDASLADDIATLVLSGIPLIKSVIDDITG